MVVCVVTDQTVGDRRFRKAATLWGEFLSHRLRVPPSSSELLAGSFFSLCIVTEASVFWDFGSLYLAALRRPSGRLLRQRPTLLYQAQAAGSISRLFLTILIRSLLRYSVWIGICILSERQGSDRGMFDILACSESGARAAHSGPHGKSEPWAQRAVTMHNCHCCHWFSPFCEWASTEGVPPPLRPATLRRCADA